MTNWIATAQDLAPLLVAMTVIALACWATEDD